MRVTIERMPVDTKLQLLCPLHPKRVEVFETIPSPNPVELRLPKPNTANNNNATAPSTRVAPNSAAKAKTPVEPLLKAFLRKLCKGAASGLSGWTEELLRDGVTAPNEANFMAMFTDIVNGDLTSHVMRVLRRSILFGISKPPNGIRPIAMGEVFVKVSCLLLLEKEKHLKSKASVGGFQHAFESDGCARIIHAVRALIRSNPSFVAVLYDCKNAFNTIRRGAIRQVIAQDKFSSLQKLFNNFYVEAGELVVRGDLGDNEHPVITSSEGVRQGDVLGPLLFCIALKPAIDKALATFRLHHPTMLIHIFAYMDDITFVGEEDDCAAFFDILKSELEEISLMMNAEKTVTTKASLSARLGVHYEECPRLLGAYVSHDNALEKYEVDLLPQKHEALFNRLPLLRAEIALRLLRLCGVPRWAHIIRTHAPEVTYEASRIFSQMTLRCFCNIMRVHYDSMDSQAYQQIILPIRLGGMGLTAWEDKARIAYETCVSGEKMRQEQDPNAPEASQGAKENAFWEEKMECIKTTCRPFYNHLMACKSKMASSWLNAEITVASSQASNSFRLAVLARLLWAGFNASKPVTALCRCGFPTINAAKTTSRAMVAHFLGCAKSGGNTIRHHMVRDTLAESYRKSGCSTVVEQLIGPDAIMDIVSTDAKTGHVTFTDTTIANLGSRSYAHVDSEKVFKQKEEEKAKKYAAIANTENATLVTFAMGAFGQLSATSRKALQSLADDIKKSEPDAIDRSRLSYTSTIAPLSRALAFGNGSCLGRSGIMRRFGFDPKRELPLIVAAEMVDAPLAAAASDDNANPAAVNNNNNNTNNMLAVDDVDEQMYADDASELFDTDDLVLPDEVELSDSDESMGQLAADDAPSAHPSAAAADAVDS